MLIVVEYSFAIPDRKTPYHPILSTAMRNDTCHLTSRAGIPIQLLAGSQRPTALQMMVIIADM